MTDQPTKHIATPTGYLMVLRQGDDVLGRIAALAEAEEIPSATFVAMGFAAKATFGFYDFAKKAFDPRSFENVEVASMTGTVAWQNGKPSLHAHGVVTGADFAAHGGHLLELEVGTGSFEISIVVHHRRLEREIEPTIKANILALD